MSGYEKIKELIQNARLSSDEKLKLIYLLSGEEGVRRYYALTSEGFFIYELEKYEKLLKVIKSSGIEWLNSYIKENM